jgi:hypothetical protein
MQHKSVITVAAVLVVAIVGGCAQSPPPIPTPAPVTTPPAPGLTLRGQDTRIVFDFKLRPEPEGNPELRPDELCCLSVGDALLICTMDGSYLEFGPQDGITLVKDNPLSRLRPVGHDVNDKNLLLTYGTLFLVASSVDRLPAGLAGYLSDPGFHRRQARALVGKLLSDDGAEFPVKSHGGTFSVFIRLTPNGRATLKEALESDDHETGTSVAAVAGDEGNILR